MTAPSVTPGQAYQGYPYTNPIVIDAPSLDAETAARWTNLPRNPIIPLQRPRDSPEEEEPTTTPSVTPGLVYQGYPYTNPIVIDAPSLDAETAARWTNLPRNPITPSHRSRDSPESTNNSNASWSRSNRPNPQPEKTTDPEPDPRVYIDFPVNELGEYVGDSDRREESRREDNRSDDANNNFVENTIFYDPFEDRRINVPQSPQASSGNAANGGSSPVAQTASSSTETCAPRIPPYMSKEVNIYGSQTSDDRFTSNTSAQEFPEPPPAYNEIDRTPVQTPPPRTEVIVPDNLTPVGLENPDRKLLLCPFCGMRVYTLAIKENGALTHVLGGFFIIAFAPLTILVYCTDYFKYRNHYCPNCNRLVGYEVPILCQDMVYTKAD